MVVMMEPTKVKLELMSDEVELIREELERAPHSTFKFFHYQKIIKKLNEALEK